VFITIPSRCPSHGDRAAPTGTVSVCRVVPGQPWTWTAAVTCPVDGCTSITIWALHAGGQSHLAVSRLSTAGAKFWDLPRRPAELADVARVRTDPLTPGMAEVLADDAHLNAAIRRDR
jgi:hypothetical protein